MTKLLALVFILGLQNASAMENVAIKSLRLSLWYQGLESNGEMTPDFFDSKKVPEKKKEISPELIELAHKFSSSAHQAKK